MNADPELSPTLSSLDIPGTIVSYGSRTGNYVTHIGVVVSLEEYQQNRESPTEGNLVYFRDVNYGGYFALPKSEPLFKPRKNWRSRQVSIGERILAAPISREEAEQILRKKHETRLSVIKTSWQSDPSSMMELIRDAHWDLEKQISNLAKFL